MSGNITYIEDWKKEYPILENIWNTYDKLDQTVDNDPKKNYYYLVCNYIIEKMKGDTRKHEEFCKKLVRNLGHYSVNYDFRTYTSNRCLNLNNWIYNSMLRHNIPKSIITECFDEYNGTVRRMKQKPTCIDYEYDKKYADPMNIIILKIFESNMNIIQNILDGAYDSINFPLLKYICECVKIYKEMESKYCPKSNAKSEKSNETCEMLITFKNTYKSYLSDTPHKKYNIPSLDKVEDDYLTICQSNGPRSALTVEMAGKITALQDSTEDGERKSGDIPSSYPDSDENQGSSTSRTVSTAFGTVAGASSILALLYKFSPGGNLIRSGIRGGKERISNNLYGDSPNELLFDGFQGEDMSSYNTRYNIGYGSV